MSLSRSPLTHQSTAGLEPRDRIDLFDNTRPIEERDDGASLDGTDGLSLGLQRERTQLSQRLRGAALRQEITKRRYARYQESRYSSEDVRPAPVSQLSSSHLSRAETTESAFQDADTEDALHQSSSRDGRLRRGQQKMRGLLHRKKRHTRLDGDIEVDVLYENQRGAFFFGYPLFSSNSLLNFDPPAWLNVYGKPSAVNITNAQLPDPSWEWAWSSWYVDMSSDVDEQGWQYSFMFQNRFAWHGTHPWFHSFVRRRRWLRKRVRKHPPGHDARPGGTANFKEAHKLNSDYFTIHPASTRGTTLTPGAASFAASSTALRGRITNDDDGGDEVENIGALRDRLRLATVDREKIGLVLRFMDEGSQDIFYLSEEMPRIMSTLIFQYSRRRLLSCMVAKIDEAVAQREAHENSGKAETEQEKVRIDNLIMAVRSADDEIQQLEFWSDIRDAIHKGESQGATSEASPQWAEGWDGAARHGRGMLQNGETTIDDKPISSPSPRDEKD